MTRLPSRGSRAAAVRARRVSVSVVAGVVGVVVGVLAGAVASVAVEGTAHAQIGPELDEADKAFERGDYDRAARLYDRAVRDAPGQVPSAAYANRAAIYVIQKQYDAGLRFVDRAEAQHPGAIDVLEQKANLLWSLGRRDEAVAVAETVVASRPATYTNQRIIGDFNARRDPARAIRAYEAYFQHRPGSLEAGDVVPRAQLGFAFLAVKRYRDAKAAFERLAREHRGRAQAVINANNGLCAALTGLRDYDRAITRCEEITRNPRHVDSRGSAWYNLGRAYLHKRRSAKAREAGQRFIRLRGSSPKGYVLVGDSYFQERDYADALQWYLRAEQSTGGARPVKLGIKLGTTYRRLGRAKQAIAVLESAIAANPRNPGLAVELGGAYLEAKADAEALATADRLIQDPSFAGLSRGRKAALTALSARALYNQGKPGEARKRWQAVRALRPRDVAARLGLVQAINAQAHASIEAGELAAAERLLSEARTIDPKSELTNQNLAVIALGPAGRDPARCDAAARYLAALKDSPRHALVYHRLMGRAAMCKSPPDPEAAAEHYAAAEKAALASQVPANLARAEIYTEWAPLLARTNLDEAIDKLETATRLAARTPNVADAARRNLAIALFRRAWRELRADRAQAAVRDLEQAVPLAGALRGAEPVALRFSLAFAYLSRGDAGKALPLLSQLAAGGGQRRYLKPPYDTLGNRFFSAYAKYRSNTARLRAQAAPELARVLARVKGRGASKQRQLVAAAWAQVASDAYQAGDERGAARALASAKRLATGGRNDRVIDHNLIALQLRGRTTKAVVDDLARLSGAVPEALVNLGIVHDREGEPRLAYDAWLKAQRRGVRMPELQAWIDAKRRIFGYP